MQANDVISETTWGAPSDREHPFFVVTKKADDAVPGVLRASIGGLEPLGHYLVYRGDEAAIEAMLEHALAAFRYHREQGAN